MASSEAVNSSLLGFLRSNCCSISRKFKFVSSTFLMCPHSQFNQTLAFAWWPQSLLNTGKVLWTVPPQYSICILLSRHKPSVSIPFLVIVRAYFTEAIWGGVYFVLWFKGTVHHDFQRCEVASLTESVVRKQRRERSQAGLWKFEACPSYLLPSIISSPLEVLQSSDLYYQLRTQFSAHKPVKEIPY